MTTGVWWPGQVVECGFRPTGKGIIRRCGLVGVGVALSKEMCHMERDLRFQKLKPCLVLGGPAAQRLQSIMAALSKLGNMNNSLSLVEGTLFSGRPYLETVFRPGCLTYL